MPPGSDHGDHDSGGMIKIVYSLLKAKLNIAKITFTSGINAASAELKTHN